MGTRRAAQVAVVWLAACGGGGSGDPDAAPPDASGPDAVSEVTVTGRVLDWINRAPQADVAVTVEDHPEIAAVMTNAEGRYSVVVPANSDIRLRCEKDTYVPLLTRVFSVGETDYATYSGIMFDALAPRAAVDLTGDILGEAYDPLKGGVVVRIQDADGGDALEGATVSLDLTGHPPLYFNDNEFPDPELTETSPSGLAVLHNYDVGTGSLSVTHATLTSCSAVGPDAPPLPLEVGVLADTTTWIPIQCGTP